MGTPIYDALADQWRVGLAGPVRHHSTAPGYGPPGGGRHEWDPDTEEVPVARHGDDDGDGIANQADPDWRPDEPDGFDPEGAYVFPDPGWRPESDFTGEWIDELVTHGTVDGETP